MVKFSYEVTDGNVLLAMVTFSKRLEMVRFGYDVRDS